MAHTKEDVVLFSAPPPPRAEQRVKRPNPAGKAEMRKKALKENPTQVVRIGEHRTEHQARTKAHNVNQDNAKTWPSDTYYAVYRLAKNIGTEEHPQWELATDAVADPNNLGNEFRWETVVGFLEHAPESWERFIAKGHALRDKRGVRIREWQEQEMNSGPHGDEDDADEE